PALNEELEYFLKVNITNKGRTPRFINGPSIQLNKKEKEGRNLFLISLADKNKYPLRLESGDEITIEYEKNALISSLRTMQIKKSNKFRVMITDTNDKKYNSNWIELDK